MTMVLVSHGFYCSHLGTSRHSWMSHDLSFSCSISNFHPLKRYAPSSKFLHMTNVFMAQQEAGKPVTNGRVSKMVSTKELMKSESTIIQKIESVNGIASPSTVVNGFKRVENGVGLVKRVEMLNNVNTLQKVVPDDFSFVDGPKVLLSDEGFSWANENYNAWHRSVDIWSFILSLQIRALFDNAKWSYFGGFTEDKQTKRRQKTASWCRERVLQLGPTFIKLGQLSSTRSDLFPKEFVDELAKLQDRVPAFSPEKARAFIENELGLPVNALFKKFEDQPIAAASLGQVHQAILHNGEKVVIKVQRPGLKRLFDIDLRNLKLIAGHFQKSTIFGGLTKDWIGIYNECSKILYQEMDYIIEGRNADRLRRDFRNVKWVRIPVVLWDYTSSKVLTLEYVPGIKISSLSQIDASGNNRSQIALRAIEGYLIQILKTGFFHADPHPGNLAIDRDGSLIYYDFGMMGEISPFTREKLLNLFYSIYEKDINKVMRSLIEVDALKPTEDISSVQRSIQFFLDKTFSHSSDQQQSLAAISEDFFAIAADQPLRLPSTLTFVMKAFSTLEGVVYMLDPEISFVRVAAPYARELLNTQQRQKTGAEVANDIRRLADEARDHTISMPYRIQKIEDFVKQLESGDLKLRVRVLESERAARKAAILQMGSIHAVLGGALFNVGVYLSSQVNQTAANIAFIGAGLFLLLLVISFRKVKKLDKLEKIP
ncbi:uncharacterized protein LOC110024395 [Phalaenopsis equestris]|uniref:uncharacterized protein LOC110024395 n=1 Tax=Phalaenopsis equestris TaxID=78828 RepID=UPI0009E1D303|nr:uncharacterized protein LOC110024395 [Phalaenopsis equestris]